MPGANTTNQITNSFMGTAEEVGNTGVRSCMDEIIQFRQQVTYKNEMKMIGGWGTPLNNVLVKGMERIRKTLALITHDPLPATGSTELEDQKDRELILEDDAKNEGLTLQQVWDKQNPISTDDVQSPANHKSVVPYDLSGKDPDIPQMTEPRFKNIFLKQFVISLDYTFRDLSNLACAPYGSTIPTDQSILIHAKLNSSFAILATKGGETNRPQIVDGTNPETLTGKIGPEIVPNDIPEPSPGTETAPSS